MSASPPQNEKSHWHTTWRWTHQEFKRINWLPALVGTLIVGSFLLLLNWWLDGTPWQGWPLGKAGLENEYCEHNRMSWLLRQPLNSLSNLLYLFVGWMIWRFGKADRQDHSSTKRQPLLIRFPLLSRIFGLSALYLFVGSLLYHASLLRWAQRIDMSATHGFMLSIVGYIWLRLLDFWHPFSSERIATLSFLLFLFISICYFSCAWPFDDQLPMYFLPLIGFLGIYLYWKKTRYTHHWWWLFLAFAIANTGAIFRELDAQKVWCLPESLLWQGHALWHCLTATAILFAYLFFRSESQA